MLEYFLFSRSTIEITVTHPKISGSCRNPKTCGNSKPTREEGERDNSRSVTCPAKIAYKLDYLSLANKSWKRGSSRKMS